MINFKDEYEVDKHYFHVDIKDYSIASGFLDYEITKYFEPGSCEPSDAEPPAWLIDKLESKIWNEITEATQR
jgi:hypothetical protein